MIIFGTRPEVIKMFPVYMALKENSFFDVKIVATAQHRKMMDDMINIFNLKIDYDLNVMVPGQSLFDVSSKALSLLKDSLESYNPDMVLVHGDTTTCLIGALAAYYMQCPIGHVEAGYRTYHKYHSFPEEANRRLVAGIADLHFASTERAKNNLLNERIEPSSIFVTGNTVVDALKWVVANHDLDFSNNPNLKKAIEKKFILFTAHRRESFGENLKNCLQAIKKIAFSYPEINVIFPVHFNPNVRKEVKNILKDIPNIIQTDPLEYIEFINLMKRAYMVITDSGSMQEEVPSFKVPTLVMREKTERIETIEVGCSRLVGTNTEEIYKVAKEIIDNKNIYQKMSKIKNPYGNGDSSKKIVQIIREYFQN